MAEIIDGRTIAKELRTAVSQQTERLAQVGVKAGLAVILVGDDPASQIYVRNKERAAKKVGVVAETLHYPTTVTQAELLTKIDYLNQNPTVDAILVQSPLPAHINEETIQAAISPAKDVDGFHPENIGRLFAGRNEFYPVANTPRGVMTMLAHEGVSLDGKNAVVIGRSILVGRPMFALLAKAGATVSLLHRGTPSALKRQLVQAADIVVVAAGHPNLLKGEDIKPGAVVIDVGINRMDDGSLVGDVDFQAVSQLASKITPVPGGVGPMTIATLLETTVELAARHHGIELEQGWQNI
ncbi:bifunctional 5,10-methylenetetrahydrofolate dehydrogenase/5,10-methenyltetrahydrofolate cyclohydrolase [Weissella halotolerans]|uniref:Bifunctional protein FolD n=1 Tax=Weissella halotolerans DSM 20190 TaxID=1123500 RepID=A0A0R2FWH0_9LACO|nr:bifunctional 5,10-methylenetetrahydrofolate dehydrogenase/5,10-methenyltetrahydrofolate cyclohydrolase [Weissella halotolerans]KRN32544.1 bifunctional protein methylenetetrahydrofolate dehydrogenase [Weissella halotolerans DSM 20190]